MKRQILRRTSKQRNIILEELRRTNAHPTADLLFRMLRRRIPAISFGTVYRNLNLLRDQGQILELICGKYSCRYDGDTSSHHHFFCLGCKKILDVYEPILKNLDGQVNRRLGVVVKYHRVDFYGYCKNCKGDDNIERR